MSDFDYLSRRIGFSTGALERGRYTVAIDWLRTEHVRSVELSALRLQELEPLLNDLDRIDWTSFSYISFHAPSSFPSELENWVVDLLGKVFDRGWNIIVHPDVIRTPSLWQRFGSQLLLENMDRRKTDARTADELSKWFEKLPDARLCLDMAHAKQLDTTLLLLTEILEKFRDRIAEVHISELDSHCRHQPMSASSVADFQRMASAFNLRLPIIVESMLDGERKELRMKELKLADRATQPVRS
ncbi:MAG TPA: hypothetical protein VH619_16930 [Verrucomicrobiae bacterium]|jgi:hypothetical protein|nr:hypothetical protein [Verrucomicrobiae bacterium]